MLNILLNNSTTFTEYKIWQKQFHLYNTHWVWQDMSTQDQFSTNLDILEEDASSSLVLEGQQLLGMLPLLLTVLLEKVGEASKGHIVTGEVEGLWRGTDRMTKAVIRRRRHPSLFGPKQKRYDKQ